MRSNEIATLEPADGVGETAVCATQLLGDSIAGDGAVIRGRNGQTLRARKGFLDFVAYGEKGPDAAGVKAAVGQNYSDLYADAKAKLGWSKT